MVCLGLCVWMPIPDVVESLQQLLVILVSLLWLISSQVDGGAAELGVIFPAHPVKM